MSFLKEQLKKNHNFVEKNVSPEQSFKDANFGSISAILWRAIQRQISFSFKVL